MKMAWGWAASLAALALAGCAQMEAGTQSTAGQSLAAVKPLAKGVREVSPENPAPFVGASVLAWDDATRSARFRKMEDHFPGLEVAPAASPRKLEKGEPLSAEQQAMLAGLMADTDAAGIMVLQNGKVRYENYGLGFGPEGRWTSFSVAKSLTSTLLGAAVKDGFVASVNDPVSKYIPGLRGSAYDDVSVEQLATMTSGVRWNEDYTDPKSDVARMFDTVPAPGEDQAVEYMKTLPRETPPGAKFVYKTGETNLIGVLVEKATGERLASYAKRKIVDPAGLSGPLFWMRDQSGRSIGGCCLSLRLSDYARIGLFAMEGGHGQVPDDWFAHASAPKVNFGGGFGYGYQWWTYPDGRYGAQGIFGQGIFIVPDKQMVMAIVSNWPVASDRALRERQRKVSVALAEGME